MLDLVEQEPSAVNASKSIAAYALAALAGLLILLGLVARIMPGSRPAPGTHWGVVATVAIPRDARNDLVDSAVVDLARAIGGATHLDSMAVAINPGEARILCRFGPGVDPDTAALQVKDRIRAAEGSFPAEVRRQGITLGKVEACSLLYVEVIRSNPQHDLRALYNQAVDTLAPVLEPVPGVGELAIFGDRQRILRLHFDVEALRKTGLSLEDIGMAMTPSMLVRPNRPIPSKTLVPRGAQVVDYIGIEILLHENPQQFGNIILRATPDGEILRLKDIGEIEFVPLYPSYDAMYSDLDRHPSVVIALQLRPGADATVVAAEIRQTLKGSSLPPGMAAEVRDDLPAAWRWPTGRPPSRRRRPGSEADAR